MKIDTITENLFFKAFVEKAGSPGVHVFIEALAEPTFKKGIVRGCWAFGLEEGDGKNKKCYKLVTSSSAQIAKTSTPNGIVAKVRALGFSIVKIPREVGQQATYQPCERIRR